MRTRSYNPQSSLLGVIKGADLQSSDSQPIAMSSSKYLVTAVRIVNASAAEAVEFEVQDGSGNAVASYAGTPTVGPLVSDDLTVDDPGLYDETVLFLKATDPAENALTADIYVFGDRFE